MFCLSHSFLIWPIHISPRLSSATQFDFVPPEVQAGKDKDKCVEYVDPSSAHFKAYVQRLPNMFSCCEMNRTNHAPSQVGLLEVSPRWTTPSCKQMPRAMAQAQKECKEQDVIRLL